LANTPLAELTAGRIDVFINYGSSEKIMQQIAQWSMCVRSAAERSPNVKHGAHGEVSEQPEISANPAVGGPNRIIGTCAAWANFARTGKHGFEPETRESGSTAAIAHAASPGVGNRKSKGTKLSPVTVTDNGFAA